MENLNKIKEQYDKSELTAKQALHEIFDTYLISDEILAEKGLTLKYFDYGMWQLREDGKFLYEGEKSYCQERAMEILNL
tara:strand:- start:8173 stop:8409 length:237 start_codon:yes stop_codon:yes gene_type:complete